MHFMHGLRGDFLSASGPKCGFEPIWKKGKRGSVVGHSPAQFRLYVYSFRRSGLKLYRFYLVSRRVLMELAISRKAVRSSVSLVASKKYLTLVVSGVAQF